MNVTTVRDWIKTGAVHLHQEELLQLAKQHTDSVRKRLNQAVVIKINRFQNGLIAVLPDCTEESFSFAKCFQKKHGLRNASVEDIKDAFRNTVDEQILEYRTSQGCRNMGDVYHVGHVGQNEFKDILKAFCSTKNLQLQNVPIVKTQLRPNLDYTSYVIADKQLSTEWQEFHRMKCDLKMQTPEENYEYGRNKF